jgi:hypothetical protein
VSPEDWQHLQSLMAGIALVEEQVDSILERASTERAGASATG